MNVYNVRIINNQDGGERHAAGCNCDKCQQEILDDIALADRILQQRRASRATTPDTRDFTIEDDGKTCSCCNRVIASESRFCTYCGARQ